MSKLLEAILTEALNDEYKARATYRLILNKFGDIPPFSNIVESESRHIEALSVLFHKYEIPIPNDTWQAKVEAPASILAACETGVEAEIENAAMYDRLLKLAEAYPDVQAVLRQLQRASQQNHLRAFQRCVARENNQGSPSETGRRRGRGQGCK